MASRLDKKKRTCRPDGTKMNEHDIKQISNRFEMKRWLTISGLIVFFPLMGLLIYPSLSPARERDLALTMNRYGLNDRVKQWAVVIGISNYQDEKIDKESPLDFADRDATAFYDFLTSSKGGGFDPNHIQLLTNEKATLFAIKRAFNDFLAKAKEDDLVVIYFAGHGSSEPERPSNLFLLPYDTDLELIRTTAYPMDEISSVLQKYINAKRVVVIADACHSGGLSLPVQLRGGLEKNLINKYVNHLTKSREGVATITASRVAQMSQEGEKWGGGHGVFTHYLLKGLGGEADGYLSDKDKDGIVTVAEAYEYTRVQVTTETNNAQTPDSGGSDIDTEIPLAVLEPEEARPEKAQPKEAGSVEARSKAEETGSEEKVAQPKFTQEEDRLEEDIKEIKEEIKESKTRVEIENKDQDKDRPAWERYRKYVGLLYLDQSRAITFEDNSIVGIENTSLLSKWEIDLTKKFSSYLLLGSTKTTIGEANGDSDLSYGGGVKVCLYQSPHLGLELGGEGRYFTSQTIDDDLDLGQESWQIQWLEYEGRAIMTYAIYSGLSLFFGPVFSKVNGQLSFKDNSQEEDTDFNETDPLGLLFGARFLYGHLQVDGEFRLADMVKSEAEGPQGQLLLGLGLRF